MATKKRKKSYKRPGSKSKTHRKNPGTRKSYGGHSHMKTYKRRRNPGTATIGEVVTTSTFVLVGALGSKLGAQLVLGTNNTGVVGYAGNLAVGAALWFVADKVMKNKTAASGVIAGTVAQLILRLLNDYTPIGSYLGSLGMGDYQAQSYVTPQILVDPTRSADLLIPNGWGPGTAPMISAQATGGPALPAGAPGTMGRSLKGMSGGSIYDGGGLY